MCVFAPALQVSFPRSLILEIPSSELTPCPTNISSLLRQHARTNILPPQGYFQWRLVKSLDIIFIHFLAKGEMR